MDMGRTHPVCLVTEVAWLLLQGEVQKLLTTDVTASGLDILGAESVFNELQMSVTNLSFSHLV